ncbi:LysR family transcriptional regulator [Rhizobium sp. SSA_523]|uniref:LysR family transcriptional regulator n=1 Tax=Rhizobium sp. SSA_523 TaxID=2952477 RepID=UPI0020903831|nr:LysR family transcriptional regulator [Rhizobium sp. SSA_523]MCO5732460.1 LysR family transcriptional regulator [Rhizobium sp. SSA_523]WKC22397.1 LysR family transcriptional regulator [Rhizobium sp. SSA_523]
MRTPFTWDDLQFFLAVARSGQLSTAARQLRSSHATVSRRIDRLEFSLKVKLFERNPRGYVLTPLGHRFVETAEKVEQEAERLQEEICGGPGLQRGVVRLSAPEGFSNFFLAQRLPDLAAHSPNISLELVTIQQIMSLSRKEADLAVVLDPPKAGPYYCEQLTEYHLGIFATADYLDAHGVPQCADDLLAHAFIGYIQDMIFAPGLDYLGDVHPRIRPGFQSSSIFSQLTATRNHLGLCVLPMFITNQYQELRPVLPELVLRRHYWLACHQDLLQVGRVRSVMDFLRSTVGTNADNFAPGL